MKRKIEQFINGRFEYELPKLELSVEKIDGTTKAGENFRGSFHIKSADGRKIKGSIYPSTGRAICNIYEFSEKSASVFFEIDVTGLKEKECAEGSFCISSSIGEAEIPFSICIEEEAIYTSKGELKSLHDFARLAASSYREAYKSYTNKDFRSVFTGRDIEYLALYDGLSTPPIQFQDMEEFLVGTGLKDPVRVRLREESRMFQDFHTSVKEIVSVVKSNWGYLKIDVSTDVPFLQLEKKEILPEDFIGSTYRLEYIIREERLHGGKNYGRITFSTCHETLHYDVVIERVRENKKGMKNRMLRKHIKNLADLYMDFRIHDLPLDQWVDESEQTVRAIEKLGSEYRYYRLYRAQLYLAQDNKEAAAKILLEFEDNPKLLRSQELRGYFAYLTALYRGEKEYTEETNRYIYDLMLQKQESWQVLWMRLYLDDSLKKSPGRTLEVIGEQFKLGIRSRIMYLEAYNALLREPGRLKQLTRFESQVVLWAAKENLLEEPIAVQCAQVSMRYKTFDPVIYQVLTACYEAFPLLELLNAVCSLLIKGSKTEQMYFKWYELAVKEGLRLTRLYEYYVDSMSEESYGILPQMIRKYFAYNNTLSYQKKAFIYANVIRNREKDADTYKSYRSAMKEFAAEQLNAGHISGDLGVIYQTYLDEIELTGRMSETLAKVLFTWEVTCENPAVKSVVVHHHPLKERQISPCRNGAAYVQLYMEDAKLVFRNEKGQKFAEAGEYTCRRLIDDSELFERCLEKAAPLTGVRLYLCRVQGVACHVSDSTLENFKELMRSDQIKKIYKASIAAGILEYLHENRHEQQLDPFLEEMGHELWIAIDRIKYTEILISQFQYKEAFRIVCQYGHEGIKPGHLVKLGSRMILQIEQEENRELVTLASHIFRMGKYDEVILSYLASYYIGSLESMCQIWKACSSFDMEIFALEERLLAFSMYLQKSVDGMDRVFADYCRQQGKGRVILAYITFEAYDYFLKDRQLAGSVARVIRRYYEEKAALDDVCYLALLKYYAYKKPLTEKEQELARALLENYAYQGYCFAFYKELPAEWIRSYQTTDKLFVEYGADPAHRVIIHYGIEQRTSKEVSYKEEVMKNIYQGICVKEFTIYFGEKLHYYITEENARGEILKQTEKAVLEPISKGSRKYEMVNEIVKRNTLYEETVCEKRVEDYITQNYLVDKMFPLA